MYFTITTTQTAASVVELKILADASVNTVEGGGVESSNLSLERGTSSATVDSGSDSSSESRAVVGLDSDEAGKRVVRALVLHRIDATISITTATVKSRLDSVTRVSRF